MKKTHRFSVWCIGLLMTLIPQLILAQSMTVQGTVTDEFGETLIGVSVVVKGTTRGTVTDYDGKYVLESVPQNSTLEFSYVGYKKQDVKVTKQVLNVTMAPDNQTLDEVVVVAYGAQKKVTVTGAVSNVNSKELMKSPSASLGNALAGKLPGVQSVQYSGMPGADDPVIRVRGIGSLNGAEPLVLVDGVERSFSQLDPNEVADISILKDASATAVFGVRGANGVILVTTKRGEMGKPSVSFSASAGLQTITRFIETTNSYTYATAYNNAQLGDGVAEANLKYSPEAIQHFKDRDMLMVYPDTNWMDYIMKDAAWQQQYNMSVSGGSEKARYFISLGMLDQDGLFETFNTDPESNFKYKRYNYRANLDIDLTKLSSISVNIGGRLENRNIIGGGEQELFRYLQSALPMAGYGIDDEGRQIIADPALVGEYGINGLDYFYRLGYVKESRNALNLDLQYKLKLDFITPGLDFKIKGSYNSNYTHQKNRKNGYGSGTKYVATLVPDENGVMQQVLRKQGTTWPLPYGESRWGDRNWYAEASLNYARRFGEHNVGALLLYNQSKTYYPWDREGLYTSIPSGYVGLVGRVTYDYKSKYMADFNMGYNGSENFAPGKRYGFFPSASIGWTPSEEKFWEPIKKVVSYMKIRASIGQVGNDNMGGARFLYLPGAYTFINGSSGHNGNGTANFGTNNGNWLPGAAEATAGNPDVTWEVATKQNYGVDMKFFNDRLSLSADFFFEDRKNILVSNASSLPAITGQQATSINFGRVKNHGYELTLRWDDRIGEVHYSIAPSLTYARNKIIEQAEVPQIYDHLYRTGHPVGQPFGYEFFEFYEPGETEKRYQAAYGAAMPNQNADVKAGDCIYVDLTGDGAIDSNDQHAIGFTDIPEYNASLNMSLSWKGFDISMLWIGASNVNRQLDTYYRPQFGSNNTGALLQWVYDNSWRPDHVEGATLPRLTFANQAHNTYNSSVWLIDASYIRLKNAEIGYTFKKIPWLPQVGSVRLYATGYNLLTFTDFKANDPEASGAAYGTFMKYPMTRVYNFGIKVNF
ncbi:MAG: TonB-dependent receptor [Bacteroides sp.]|nr:TonB-dependent receptor [Bacteroides sp.]